MTHKNKFQIISHLYGITVDKASYIELGNFILCDYNYLYLNYQNSKDTFSRKFNHGIKENKIALIDNYFIIMKNIKANDEKEARQKFYNNVEDFINVVLYSIPMLTPENQQITITQINASDEIFIIKESSSSEFYATKDLLNPIYKVNENLFNIKGNSRKLFEFIDDNNLSEIETKIKRSVSWVGQSLRKTDIVESFLNLCVAFETLFCYQREFISDSLISQMTEQAAYICEKNLEARKTIIKNIKDLYSIRSSIVHRGSADIKDDDFFLLLSIIKKIIQGLLKLIETQNIKTAEQLRNFLIDKKFSV